MQPGEIAAEMERSGIDFLHLVDTGTTAELRGRSDGIKWTNEQLLFHMLFGYLLVHNLLPLVRTLARLPRSVSRALRLIFRVGLGTDARQRGSGGSSMRQEFVNVPVGSAEVLPCRSCLAYQLDSCLP